MSEISLELATKVKEIIAEKLGLAQGEITLESNFKTDLHADSLDIVEVIMALEQGFGITIPDEHAESLGNVQMVVEYIQKHQSVAPAAGKDS